MGRYSIIRTYHQLERVDEEFYNNDEYGFDLIEPELTLALNENGSLSFTMPITHKYFGTVLPMSDEFMVRDTINDETLFVGRPISCKNVNFDRIEVYCEGALGYMHDILVRPEVWKSTSPSEFFSNVIDRYNSIKTPRVPHQEIQKGVVDIPYKNVYREANYDDAYELLHKGCVDSEGGYFTMSYGPNGEKILNWTLEPPQPTEEVQKVEYGRNIISFSESLDLSSDQTFMLAFGSETEQELPGDLGKARISIDPVGLGVRGFGTDKPWYEEYAHLIKRYGYIEMKKDYNDADTVDKLKEAVRADRISEYKNPDWLGDIECVVADMSFISNDLRYAVGQRVQLVIPNQFYTELNNLLYVNKVVYKLDRALKTISIGPKHYKDLTDQFANSKGGSGSGAGSRTPSDHYLYVDDTFTDVELQDVALEAVTDDAIVKLTAPLMVTVNETFDTIRIDKVDEMELQEIKELIMFDKYFLIFYIWNDVMQHTWATLYQDYWWGVDR